MSRPDTWGETLEQTIARSRIQKGLLVYSLCAGEIFQAVISGVTPEAVRIDRGRTITARSLGTKIGSVEIIGDTATEDSWTSRTLCLGSYAFSMAGAEFQTPGLLRGMISQNGGVMVDFGAQHFTGNQAPLFLMAEYETLYLENELIF